MASSEVAGKKIIAGVLGIIFGSFGVHKFVLGYIKEGLIMLLVSVLLSSVTHGYGATVMAIIGLIEGIIYLTKSDDEFASTYISGRRPWF